MNWKERLNESDRVQKIELTKRSIGVYKVIKDLCIEDKLNEIRNELWEIGQVKCISEIGLFNSLNVKTLLSTSWPVYCPEHKKKAYRGNQEVLEFCPSSVRVHTTSLEIAVSELYHGIYFSQEPPPYFGFDKEMWDTIPGINLDFYEPITKRELDQFDNSLFLACRRFSNEYPLTIKIEKDRQEIIDKVLSGQLVRSAVPADFGYEFPPKLSKYEFPLKLPKPPETFETIVKPQKKRFSLREFLK